LGNKQLISNDDYTFVEEGMRLPVTSTMQFQSLDSLIDIIYGWAEREHMLLVRSKFEDERRLFLTCKFSDRFSQNKARPNGERQATSFKNGCQFIIRITYKAAGEYWFVIKPKFAEEHCHSHPCTEAYHRITPQHLQRYLAKSSQQNRQYWVRPCKTLQWAKSETTWWKIFLTTKNSLPIQQVPFITPVRTIYVDASDAGWKFLVIYNRNT
ncbi:hypothetical protein CU098_000437, partial [Rhizopus stolonifer]